MDTYLLDTNLVSVLYDSQRPNHQTVRQAIRNLDPQAPQLISAVTIAELRFGLALSRAVGRPLHHIEACIGKAEEHPLAGIGRYTAEAFAHVKSSLAQQRLNLQRRIPRWVEGWTDRVTSQVLQIDENDLWIAAQAIERNYVIVTSDRDFINVIAPALTELRVNLV
ncbi:PIN domain-containing protein [Rhizobium leguminosarum]|uniref:PIN domain-containing protein n=1 Tax=Rhizobium leguminosarum TaxID=384 RepID=UPI001C98212C|nr:PIN domain-containing protein [Rhizobium leguminosarum]MBY5523555.1 type II toxin-antitoxin system VapC family toxin [Rhizobium leguminosarum]